ncbi:hypothetical protein ACET3Z_010877 [Daucus carota]
MSLKFWPNHCSRSSVLCSSDCSSIEFPEGILMHFTLYTFARHEDARGAESLNGQLEIAGRAIKVSMPGFDDRLVNGGSILELIGKERRNGKSPEEVGKIYAQGI